MPFHAGHKYHHSSTASRRTRRAAEELSPNNNGAAGNDEIQVGDNRSLTVMTNKRRENIAYMWWNSHLRPGRSDWLQFKPPSTYKSICGQICDFGFIPVQYKTACPQKKDETKDKYSRRFKKYVLKNGTQGVHYAIGWVGLYDLVVKYGVISKEPPRYEKHAHSILSYNGPHLVEESSTIIKVPRSTVKPCSSASLPLKKRLPTLTVIFTPSPPPSPALLVLDTTTSHNTNSKEDHEPIHNQQMAIAALMEGVKQVEMKGIKQLPSHQAMLNGDSSDGDDDKEEKDGHALAIATFMEHYDPLPKNPRCVQKWDV